MWMVRWIAVSPWVLWHEQHVRTSMQHSAEANYLGSLLQSGHSKRPLASLMSTPRASAWEALAPEQRRQEGGTQAILPDPRHEVQTAGGLADFWYLDDGDVLCDPLLDHLS